MSVVGFNTGNVFELLFVVNNWNIVTYERIVCFGLKHCPTKFKVRSNGKMK